MPWHQEAMKDVGKAAISFGELLTGYDPEISEWGNPIEFILYYRAMNS